EITITVHNRTVVEVRRSYFAGDGCPGVVLRSAGSRAHDCVGHIRETPGIGRPGIDVDAALAAGELDDKAWLDVVSHHVARHRDHAELDAQPSLIVPFGAMWKRKE